MNGAARRQLALLTAVMPPGRRAFGQAMLAELDYTRSRRDRLRLVLAAVRVALLPPSELPGLGGYGRAAVRGALVAALGAVPLIAGLYLTNVVFPSPQDSTAGDLLMDAYLIVTLMAAGAAARRAEAATGQRIVAGLVAGLIIALLGMAAFAVIDNAFLSVVMQQTAKLDGFRASGLTSMRAYINDSLEATAPGVGILLAVAGAVLGPLGALADRRLVVGRARRLLTPHPDQLR